MFAESPFSGVCAAATYEVLAMLLGTLLLGLLLGFLIWGWLRKKVSHLQKEADKYRHVADLREVQIVDLNTRIATLNDQLERSSAKLSLSDFRMRNAQEEIYTLRSRPSVEQQSTLPTPPVETKDIEPDPAIITYVMPGQTHLDEPTLADISLAMETGFVDKISIKAEDPNVDPMSVTLGRGNTEESLEIARRIFDSDVRPDDLKLIIGIDSKIEELLGKSGIHTWADLALSRLPDLRHIIEESGPRYRALDPKTWPIQARMAAKGEWKKLKAYQETIVMDDD